MLAAASAIRELRGFSGIELPREVLEPTEPLVLRGLVSHWPAVQLARRSDQDLIAYLVHHCSEVTVNAIRLDKRHQGRVFYNDDMSGFNFSAERLRLQAVLEELQQLYSQTDADTLYVGSSTVDVCLPEFRADNDLSLGGRQSLVSIWLGNQTRVAAHHDLPENVACCVAGKRQFTLFPPEQIANLYPGPVDLTPAGQVISLVDFMAPDLERFPRFEQALASARTAELEPGDAIVIPSLWWHHVVADGPFNVLVNYWWRNSPGFMDPPGNVLDYAMLSLRDLPAHQRKAWLELFRYYIFEFGPDKVAHLPAERRGILGPMDEARARALRAQLLNRLRR